MRQHTAGEVALELGDARISWRPEPWIDLSLMLLGLSHDGDPEFGQSTFGGRTGIETSGYVSASFRF